MLWERWRVPLRFQAGGGLACGSGREVRVGRVRWEGRGFPSAADVAGTARGLRAVSKKKTTTKTGTLVHRHAWRCVPTDARQNLSKTISSKTVSSKSNFIHLDTLTTNLIKNQFHPKPLSKKNHSTHISLSWDTPKNAWGGENDVFRKSAKALPMFSQNHGYARFSGFNRFLCGASPAVSYEGLLKPERRNFRGLRFRVQVFRCSG